MEIRRHFGAKAKEKEAKDDFGSGISDECQLTHSWCRSTPFRPSENPRRFQVYISSSLPQKISLFVLLVLGRF